MIILSGVVELLFAILITHISPILEAHGVALKGGVVVLGPFVEGGQGIIGTFPFTLFRILKERLHGKSIQWAALFVLLGACG